MRIFLCFILASAILSSCDTSFSLVKRKYRPGYYVNRSGDQRNTESTVEARKNTTLGERESDTVVQSVASAEVPVASMDFDEPVVAEPAACPQQQIVSPVEKAPGDTAWKEPRSTTARKPAEAPRANPDETSINIVLIILLLFLGSIIAFYGFLLLAIVVSIMGGYSGGLDSSGITVLIVGAVLIALTDVIILMRALKKRKAQQQQQETQQ